MSFVLDQVFVNQLGYRTHGLKRFTAAAEGEFSLVSPCSDQALFSGTTGRLTEDVASGIAAATGDFTAFTQPGRYAIRMTHTGEQSPEFVIGEEVYSEVYSALLKCFYYQRCGVELEEAYAGPWSHQACHTADASVHGNPTDIRPQTGGWHDAGDYGKYTVAAAKAVADLLLTLEWFPEAGSAPFGIPNDSPLPDLLDEVRFELDFMLKLQREDGAVYHKVTTASFPPLDCMPEDDHAPLIFSPVSATATASFAASMAMAARVYQSYDPALAATYSKAAVQAWGWLQSKPEAAGFRNPPDIITGEYGDECCLDEQFWAASELYRLTESAEYMDIAESYLKGGAPEFPLCELGWADAAGYGTLCLLTMEPSLVPSSIRSQLLQAWIQEAETYAGCSLSDPFGLSLLPGEYIWGSNMLVMNRAMLLITAERFTGDSKYGQAAVQHWDYLLGRNVLGTCYVTGFGSRQVLHPHHRPSVGDRVDAPVPGMVAGGPNRNLQDEAAVATLKGCAPAACFVDHPDSYSTNEMTIYWNSPAVFVAAYANKEHV